MAVLKSDEYVKATEAVTMVCSNSMKINAVHFKNHIHFVGLPLNFVISIDIHAMVSVSEMLAAVNLQVPSLILVAHGFKATHRDREPSRGLKVQDRSVRFNVAWALNICALDGLRPIIIVFGGYHSGTNCAGSRRSCI